MTPSPFESGNRPAAAIGVKASLNALAGSLRTIYPERPARS